MVFDRNHRIGRIVFSGRHRDGLNLARGAVWEGQYGFWGTVLDKFISHALLEWSSLRETEGQSRDETERREGDSNRSRCSQ